MAAQPMMAMLEGNKIVLLSSEEVPLSLDEVPGRIVMLLHSKRGPLTGSQLSKELKVGQSTITKATDKLVKMGILQKEPSEIARNVKLYYLQIRVIDEKYVAEVEKRVPRVIRETVASAFRGQERLALVFADQLMDYVRTLPEDRQAAVLEEFFGKIGKKKNA